MHDLDGKVAVVTGGAQGIGRGIAEALSEAGATIVIADLNEETAQATADDLSGEALGVRHDVRKADSASALDAAIQERFGRLDIIVNNAGVGPNPGPMTDLSEEEWDRVMDINARGVFLTTRALVPRLIAQESGRIINLSSIVGQVGKAMILQYAASKFAVYGMTQCMAEEFAPYGITANNICPGIVATELMDVNVVPQFGALTGQTTDEAWEGLKAEVPLGRLQTPEDIGAVAAFLASDKAKNITDASFNVDGGQLMR
jgi:meso-butanediol dehydrogenase / (S,S)-butanediol dehydrogenase / diacetyl reductase